MRQGVALLVIWFAAPSTSVADDAPLWWPAVEERITLLRAAREPVEPAQLKAAPVPKERNAAPIVVAAGNLLLPQGRDTLWSRRLVDLLPGYFLPLTPEQREEVAALLSDGEAALKKLDGLDEAAGFN